MEGLSLRVGERCRKRREVSQVCRPGVEKWKKSRSISRKELSFRLQDTRSRSSGLRVPLFEKELIGVSRYGD